MKDPTGKPAPAGGFKDLGWYGGYQYYQGSFAPQAGVIHPNSPQAGAGKAVSQEVNRQSDQQQNLPQGTIQNYVNTQNNTPQPQNMPGYGTSTASGVNGVAGTGAGLGITAPATIDLPKLYEQLYANSGVKDLEGQLSAKEKAFNDAQLKINDNPFLSEGTRTGRIQKLSGDYQNSVSSLQKDVATRKADIETQLNLQTKQFDINSTAARQAMDQFNTLLSSGALDNASGDDIANLTRATGLSSSMIASAVDATKQKNRQTSAINFDDGTNQGFAIIDAQTGEIISKQVISASKPKATTASAKASTQDYSNYLKEDARAGKTLSQIFAVYSGYLTPDQIYSLYNSNSKYGPDKGDIASLRKYGVTIKDPNE